MATKFKDDEMYIKQNDIDAIRRRPSMWISSLGESGVFHLCKEIIDNNRDECYKKNSPGDTIEIDITNKCLTTRDNGRGIPTSLLREVFETTQAGSNMTRSGGATAGENGVGTTCVLALSSELIVTTIRPNEKKKLTLHYKEAKLVSETLEDYTGSDHGLIVSFKPSMKVMGVNEIPIHMLEPWIADFDYTLPKTIKARYTINGVEHHVQHKSLHDFINERIKVEEQLSSVLSFQCNGKLKETVLGKEYNRSFKLDIAIMYTNPDTYRGDDIHQSWMNMINTIDHGSHVDGVINGFTKYVSETISKKNKKMDNVDIKKDVLSHMTIVVNAMCDCATMFSAQAKHKVFLRNLGTAIANSVYEALQHISPSTMSTLIEAVIGNHRARIEGEKMRNVASAVRVKKKWTIPDSYIPCSSVKTDIPRELFLVEGKSAGGGLDGARDARYQAILKFRGKSLNVYDEDIDKALNSDSWKDLIPVMECGVGPTFDIKKLKFDKIIIATDADIDGFHIRTIICTFFRKFLPEIIDAGKLYIAEPPLYQLVNGKDVSYVATQTEYIEKCIKSIGDLRISFPGNTNTNIHVQDFVKEAFDYLNILTECSFDRSVDRYLLEYIAYGLATYGGIDGFVKNVDKWLRSLAKIYPEIGFNHDTNQIFATINFVDQVVVVDEGLYQSVLPLIQIILKYGFIIQYHSSKRNLDQQSTIAKFFEYIETLYPTIKARFKGLGSSDPEVMREVVMDPRTRRLIRITANDVNTMVKMGALVGDGKDNIRERKEMLLNFKFTKADIDN